MTSKMPLDFSSCSGGGSKLHIYRWPANLDAATNAEGNQLGKPRSAIVFIHGLHDYAGRYAEMCELFAENGHSVYAFDLFAHGRSEGRPRGSMRDTSQTLKDVVSFLNEVVLREVDPDVPLILAGKAIGAVLCLQNELLSHERLEGVLLISPAAKVKDTYSRGRVAMGKLASKLAPGLGVAEVKVEHMSRDADVVKAYLEDPLVCRSKIDAGTGVMLLKTLDSQAVDRVRKPILILGGGCDQVVDSDAAVSLYDRLPSQNKVVKIYQPLFHDIVHEPERDHVLADMISWLEYATVRRFHSRFDRRGRNVSSAYDNVNGENGEADVVRCERSTKGVSMYASIPTALFDAKLEFIEGSQFTTQWAEGQAQAYPCPHCREQFKAVVDLHLHVKKKHRGLSSRSRTTTADNEVQSSDLAGGAPSSSSSDSASLARSRGASLSDGGGGARIPFMRAPVIAGWLFKRSHKGQWQKRWFELDDDHSLQYRKDVSEPVLGVMRVLASADDTQIGVVEDCAHAFEIRRAGGLTMTLQAESAADADRWLEKLRSCAQLPSVTLDDFHLRRVVGVGGFGKVMQVQHKASGKIYAMKVIEKRRAFEKKKEHALLSEKKILQQLDHPFLVNLHFAFQTPAKVFLVMDFQNGGELFTHMQAVDCFDEPRTQFYLAEITLGVEYLHSKGVIYRDLKPENVLLTAKGHICLTDFGISKADFQDDDRTHTIVGTSEYMAPEVMLGEPYGKAVDWWAVGILMFEMLTGLPAFYDDDKRRMCERIVREPVQIPKTVSDDAQRLLRALLEKEPRDRLADGKTVRAQAFFRGIDWDALAQLRVKPPYRPPVSNEMSTAMFDEDFTRQAPIVEEDKSFARDFVGFTYKKE